MMMLNKKNLILNIAMLAISVIITCALGEVLLRLFFSDRFVIHKEERSLLYHYDEYLGWFPTANIAQTFVGSHPIHVSHNSRGFRDIEQVKSAKPGILFLGDSFVWGYDVEAKDRFTEKLRSRLPDWDLFNLGVSGYGTDQELLLLMAQFDYYCPKLVFLVYCTYNDDFDNAANTIGNGWYYKPYFVEDTPGHLQLKGVPVPKSLSYLGSQYPLLTKSYLVRLIAKSLAPALIKNEYPPTTQIITKMNEFITSRGSRLVVGLTEPHRSLENLFREKGIPYVMVNGEAYPANGFHWTPAGHSTVSATIYDFLQGNGLLNVGNARKR